MRRQLNKMIAEFFGYFFCPVCGKYFRQTNPVLIGGHNVCSRCASEIISKRIAGWYGDYGSR